MSTATLKKGKTQRVIHWGLPSSDTEITVEDYRAMIKSAERGKSITFEEYTQRTHAWLQKNL